VTSTSAARTPTKRAARDFWAVPARGSLAGARASRRAFNDLVERVLNAQSVELFEAVEAGVPTYLVDLIAAATGQAAANVIDMLGVSATTFRRKDVANEPLPDVAGHRVMGLLRIAATLRRLLEDSGDPQALGTFDVDAWLATWMQQALPELGGKTPADMLRNPEGLRAVEQVLERMRGGLPA